MAEAPSIWSKANPRLQRAWDATSLRALMFCPRYYQYTVVEGYRGSSVDLEYGILFHGALDVFEKARLSGQGREEAMFAAVRWALENSGQYRDQECVVGVQTWHPWSGAYESMWRCAGDVKYKNEKGNAAKCPYAHKGNWQRTEAPAICGECGGTVEAHNRWVSARPEKDRYALVRMVQWYCDEQPLELGKGAYPIAFPDGTPAVELNFAVPLPWVTPEGKPGTEEQEDYLLCGYLDGIKRFGAEHFIGERKTTGKALNKMFWNGFSPHIQIDTYDVVGAALFPDLDIKGVLIEGAQALVSGARFGKTVAYRTEAQREEYMADLRQWLDIAEKFASEGQWPMNRANCWLCPFKGVCSKAPASREGVLAESFERKHWNPLEER